MNPTSIRRLRRLLREIADIVRDAGERGGWAEAETEVEAVYDVDDDTDLAFLPAKLASVLPELGAVEASVERSADRQATLRVKFRVRSGAA